MLRKCTIERLRDQGLKKRSAKSVRTWGLGGYRGHGGRDCRLTVPAVMHRSEENPFSPSAQPRSSKPLHILDKNVSESQGDACEIADGGWRKYCWFGVDISISIGIQMPFTKVPRRVD